MEADDWYDNIALDKINVQISFTQIIGLGAEHFLFHFIPSAIIKMSSFNQILYIRTFRLLLFKNSE